MRPLIFIGIACLTAGIAAAQAGSTILSSDGNWDLRETDGSPGHDGACVLAPKTQSRVQVTRDRVDVTGMPRNSIFNYQYRIDEGPASTPAFPTDAMQMQGRISIDGEDFKAIVKGRRLRIRILDKWHESITEDVDLMGLDGLYARMQGRCK